MAQEYNLCRDGKASDCPGKDIGEMQHNLAVTRKPFCVFTFLESLLKNYDGYTDFRLLQDDSRFRHSASAS